MKRGPPRRSSLGCSGRPFPGFPLCARRRQNTRRRDSILVETTIPAIQDAIEDHVITAEQTRAHVSEAHRGLQRRDDRHSSQRVHSSETRTRSTRLTNANRDGDRDRGRGTSRRRSGRHPDDPQGQYRHSRHADDRRIAGVRRIVPAVRRVRGRGSCGGPARSSSGRRR